MSGRWSSVFAELTWLYAHAEEDVDFSTFLTRHKKRERADEQWLAEAIDADGRIRIGLGRPVDLARYLEAIPDLRRLRTALDAAIEFALRSRWASGASKHAAAADLEARYPDLAEAIAVATELCDVLPETTTPGDDDRPNRHADDERRLPDLIEGYRLLAELHRGGQGIVYKALQESTGRLVAVKVLSRGQFATEDEKRRFQREIHLAASLDHANIITIYESGLNRGRHYYAMQYVEGRPLDAYVAEERPNLEETLRLFMKVCWTVSYAHDHGVIHRDLKPRNVLVDADGEPHVLDFGIAKPSGTNVLDGIAQVTDTRDFVGTLAYASPEQLVGDSSLVDRRTDVYALGVILYELLTDQHPYAVSGDLLGTVHMIMDTQPGRPSRLRPDLNDDLDTIVLGALAKDRDRRYRTAGELGRDVERVLRGEPIAARRDSLAYRIRTWYRSYLYEHRAVSYLLIIVLASVLTHAVGGPLLFRWTPVNTIFERLLVGRMPSAIPIPPFRDVQVVAFDDLGELEAVARARGLAEVSAGDIKSFRRLHGSLMERLARTGADVVAWDISFEGESPFDDDFVRGIEAMEDRGKDVIVSTRTWGLEGTPGTSGTILQKAAWGCTTGRFRPDAPWRLHLVVQRGRAEPMVALALLAVASSRQTRADVAVQVDRSRQSAHLNLSPEATVQTVQANRPPTDTVHVELSTLSIRAADTPALGLNRGDVVGDFLLRLPDADSLTGATVAYTDVFATADEELEGLFGGKILLVADHRPGVDRHDYLNGRTGVSGSYAHAAAVQSIMERVWIRYPRTELWALLTVAAAGAGLVIARFTGARRGPRYLLLAAATSLLVLGSVAAYWFALYLWQPLMPVLALLIACELAAVSAPISRLRSR